MSLLSSLDPAAATLLVEARRAVLATVRPNGQPRLVPIAFAADPAADVVYSALDEKPKSVSDTRQLARVRDIAVRPRVELLLDRWREDWSQLAWLRLSGHALLVEPGGAAGTEHGAAVALLRERYEQYREQALEQRPVLRIDILAVRSWSAT